MNLSSGIFKNKNIIEYDADHFTKEEAIGNLLSIKTEYSGIIGESDIVTLKLKKNSTNSYSINKSDYNNDITSANFLLNGSKNELKETSSVLFKPIQIKEKINRIKLSTPFLNSDKRWDSIGLTASSLFLGSSLTENSFAVTLENISLPFQGDCNFYKNIDACGFTLFEDILLQFKDFLKNFPPVPKIITVAGGPFITLNPLGAMYHLPEINLFIRGEGETVFPEILKSLVQNDIDTLMSFKGFLFQKRGLIISSDYNKKNVTDISNSPIFYFKFADKKKLANGLEMNFSRGCLNNCIFCSKVQGRKLRKLPFHKIEELFRSYKEHIKQLSLNTPESNVISINDDDILQDPEYAFSVFQIIIKSGLKLWGVQSSITSFFDKDKNININPIKIISNKELYNKSPLLWIGTDTFLKKRSLRLGKPLPETDALYDLLEKFELYEIDNYHYWISSDHLSTWEEFIDELIIIYNIHKRFSRFSLLAHAPFLIPYPSTPAYKLIIKSGNHRKQIKYKKILKGFHHIFNLPLVDHVTTNSEYLNRLLYNEKLSGGKGFFDYLKDNDMLNAIICAYNFLKKDRISAENCTNKDAYNVIRNVERKAEEFITKIV